MDYMPGDASIPATNIDKVRAIRHKAQTETSNNYGALSLILNFRDQIRRRVDSALCEDWSYFVVISFLTCDQAP